MRVVQMADKQYQVNTPFTTSDLQSPTPSYTGGSFEPDDEELAADLAAAGHIGSFAGGGSELGTETRNLLFRVVPSKISEAGTEAVFTRYGNVIVASLTFKTEPGATGPVSGAVYFHAGDGLPISTSMVATAVVSGDGSPSGAFLYRTDGSGTLVIPSALSQKYYYASFTYICVDEQAAVDGDYGVTV